MPIDKENSMISDDDYEDWVKQRRSESPSIDLTDKVMAAIEHSGISKVSVLTENQ